MDALWGPLSSEACPPLLQSPEITVLLTPSLCIVQDFLSLQENTGDKEGEKGQLTHPAY